MTSVAPDTSAIVIRDIGSAAEMRAVEELQKEVWGLPDLDVVPFSHLVATKTAGGVLVGAFEGETLIGFVYGFTSYEDGEMAHHSHMLAVKPAYRNFKLGHKLKLAQRERVVEQGIRFMTWTYDPLQSLNAHFNLSTLGVFSDRYFIDFYGDDAASFLHRNGTDRLWVTWPLIGSRVNERLDEINLELELERVVPLVQLAAENQPHKNALIAGLARDTAAIEIPADINTLQEGSVALASQWREATRWAFTEALAAGYVVVDFHRQQRGEQRLGIYLLSRKETLKRFQQKSKADTARSEQVI
jgi:predicted GNAT superfamily acetyltransferase